MVVILVVDDSATDRTRIAGLLSRMSDYEVITASGGAEAKEILSASRIDLVLTDLQMPEVDGLELVKDLRRNHSDIPVVLMTGTGSEEIAVQAMKAGAANYVNKTSGPKWLRENIERVLSAQGEIQSHRELLKSLRRDEYEFLLGNDRGLMASTARFLRQVVQSTGLCADSDLPRLGIAMEEALLNACLHGNLELDSVLREGDDDRFNDLARKRSASQPWKDRHVTVRASISPKQFKVEITDDGPGFDPSCLPDPTASENLLKPHGRGIMMMRLFLDDVQWNERGNRVTMIKNARPS
ncbi:MAG: response regulator [Fuerstiella sp.]|nr:response regulator [Fuerstiella sp.]